MTDRVVLRESWASSLLRVTYVVPLGLVAVVAWGWLPRVLIAGVASGLLSAVVLLVMARTTSVMADATGARRRDLDRIVRVLAAARPTTIAQGRP